jgi:methyl-accepting chemotaxis protein
MGLFKNLHLSAKIGMGYGFILTLAFVVSVIGYNSIQYMTKSFGWVDHTHKVINTAENVRQSMINMETGVRGFLLTGEDEYLEPYYAGLKTFDKEINIGSNLTSDNPTQTTRWKEVQKLKDLWIEKSVKVEMQARRDIAEGVGDYQDLMDILYDKLGKTYMDKTRKVLDDIVHEEERLLVIRDKDQSDTASFASTFMMIGTIILIVVGVIIALFVVKGVKSTLRKSISVAIDGVDDIVTSSKQLHSYAANLSDSANNQAASIEQMGASIEEATASIEQNSNNAREADTISKETSTAAQNGYEHIQKLSQSMQDINESSTKISNIIKTIDEIAFQTNLLALNAAVEAARAGEHGLGFAVVAEEVRSLAGRSAEAAKETADIIETSIEEVKNGNSIVLQTTSSFEGILDKIDNTVSLNSEISVASSEQSDSMGQINNAIVNIDSLTQNVSASAEELSAAAEELNSKAISVTSSLRVLVDSKE